VTDDRNSNDQDPMLDPEDVNSDPTQASHNAVDTSVGGNGSAADQTTLDPNDEIPVPIAMSPAEIDERAQAVEALRRSNSRAGGDDQNVNA
jgi:hypothetical protein